MSKSTSSSSRWGLGILGVLVLLLGGGIGYALWQFGEPESFSHQKPSLHVTGAVTVERGGKSISVTDGMEVLPADRIVVSKDARAASITWSDSAETRLDPGADIVVDAVDRGFSIQVRGGRVWSRLLKLLDLDMEAKAIAPSVVATVRGTAFGVATDGKASEIAVTESVVDIQRRGGDQKNWPLREGRWGRYSLEEKEDVTRDLRPDDAWPVAQGRMDEELARKWVQDWQDAFASRDRSGLFDRLGESLRLMIASDVEDTALNTAYAKRRIASATVAGGDRGEGYLRDRSSVNALSDAQAMDVAIEVQKALFLLTQRGQALDSPTVKLLREWRSDLLGRDEASRWFAEAILIDDRIDEILSALPPLAERSRRVAEVVSAIDALQGREKELDAADAKRAPHRAAKVRALRERLRGIGLDSDVPTPTMPSEGATSTAATSSTAPEIIPTRPTTTTKPTTPPIKPPTSTSCAVQRIAVFVKPSTQLTVGVPGTVSVLAACADGTTKDVSGYASLTATNPGQIQGSSLTMPRTGSSQIFATYSDQGKSFSGSASVTAVVATRVLSGVTVKAIGTTSLTTGQSMKMDATASFADGGTSIVTYQCKWGVSDARMGMVKADTFYSLSGTGPVSAFCTYTEGTVTKVGTITFQVSLDPALMPTNGTPGGNGRTNGKL